MNGDGPAGARVVVHLGTRACSGAVEAALDEPGARVLVLVPAEPRLLGEAGEDPTVREGLTEVADLLADRVRERAREAARRREEPYADVFGREADPDDRVEVRVPDDPLAEALAAALDEADAASVYVARDALDVLDGAGVRLADALEGREVELVAP